jgi:hypothetical protein
MLTHTYSKTLPSEAAKAMQWKGTVKGSTILSGARGDEELMATNEADQREFKLPELLDAQQFKGFFGGGRGALLTQIKNLEGKIAEAELQAADPLRATISKMSTDAMVRKLKIIVKERASEDDKILLSQFVLEFDTIVAEVPLEGHKLVRDRTSRLRLILRQVVDLFINDVRVTGMFPPVLVASNEYDGEDD